MKRPETDYIVEIESSGFLEKAKDHLTVNGFVVLRGCFSKDLIDEANTKVASILEKPSIGGSVGYYMKDPYKKLFDGLLVGRAAVNMVANHKVIEVVEDYLQGDVLLTEVFLKNDLGSNKEYFPYHSHLGDDLELNESKVPFGCGTIIYLHDTKYLLRYKTSAQCKLNKKETKQLQ